MNILKYIISNTQYLKINHERINSDECQVCVQIDIDYVDEERNICIRFGYEYASTFCYAIAEYGRFQKLIDGNMMLDINNTGDLGFEWNQYFQGILKNTEVDQYLLWSNSHKQIRPYFNSWIYNDQDGNIIFEITPFYPWHDATKKSNPDFISYKKFMKDYKPIVQTIIPKENIKTWIEQAQALKKTLVD